MAGNVKEWDCNAVGDKRYILGGAWNEPNYQYSANGRARSRSTARRATAFRCMSPTPGTRLDAALDRPMLVGGSRLHRREASDRHVFGIYRSLYAYDRSDLKAVVESTDDSSGALAGGTCLVRRGVRQRAHSCISVPPEDRAPPYQTVVYFPAGQNLRQFEKWEINYLDFILQSGPCGAVADVQGHLRTAARTPAVGLQRQSETSRSSG